MRSCEVVCGVCEVMGEVMRLGTNLRQREL